MCLFRIFVNIIFEDSHTAMQNEQRKRLILELVQQNPIMDVDALATKMEVSTMTIRRDLKELDHKKLLQRTHGGAIKLDNAHLILSNFDLKINEEKAQKVEICEKAATFIEDGDIIFIDCGTTLFHLSKLLSKFKNLRVITNSLPVASELINHPNIKINIIGGEVDSNRKAMYGKKAEESINEYHANKAFIGADAISIANGISSYDENESAITKNMALNSDKIFLLCSSSKIEKNSFVKFLPASILNYLITDSNVQKSFIKEYNQQNINVIF